MLVRLLVATLAVWGLTGCTNQGSDVETVPVEGTVRLDGTPLQGAVVMFTPASSSGAAPAYGETDEEGHYYLQYSSSQDGAMPGDYLVSITTFREAEEDEDGNLIEAQPETVPARYNLETELTATVEEGGGPYDFQLELGDVIQPIEPTDDE